LLWLISCCQLLQGIYIHTQGITDE
jgi:hypothetical protein